MYLKVIHQTWRHLMKSEMSVSCEKHSNICQMSMVRKKTNKVKVF